MSEKDTQFACHYCKVNLFLRMRITNYLMWVQVEFTANLSTLYLITSGGGISATVLSRGSLHLQKVNDLVFITVNIITFHVY